MTQASWTIRGLRAALADGTATPATLSEQALALSNGNHGQNTYLWQNAAWTRAEAERAQAMPHGPLWGLPVSVKDCFDLAGAPTTCGTYFYRDLNGIATRDSWVVERLRAAGAVITGKTHLHPLAYGITGQNPEYGDCLQPRDATALTGGSSSGAAASVQEGSAVIAIGTDTGGSVRVPAALCGLAGYRASIGHGDWRGGTHLAESFDTMGFLFRDLEDAPLLGDFFPAKDAAPARPFTRFAVVGDQFLHDCDPRIVDGLRATAGELESLGLEASPIDTSWWEEAIEILAPIQAWEAARLHVAHFGQGLFNTIEPSIRERLEWGAAMGDAEIAALRERHQVFRSRFDALIAEHQLLMLPAAPLARLEAGADHTRTRPRLVRYTAPFSLAGVPVVTVPCATGGMQLAAARGADKALLELAARLGASR
jgi:Asp-tRNA(Asn)/Glu-tRNA(Gln) amidotransferase A subunit family amidase